MTRSGAHPAQLHQSCVAAQARPAARNSMVVGRALIAPLMWGHSLARSEGEKTLALPCFHIRRDSTPNCSTRMPCELTRRSIPRSKHSPFSRALSSGADSTHMPGCNSRHRMTQPQSSLPALPQISL